MPLLSLAVKERVYHSKHFYGQMPLLSLAVKERVCHSKHWGQMPLLSLAACLSGRVSASSVIGLTTD